ncbi:DUF397 domain-containing protein [Streptomyces sp. NBC_00287]|nr:DUF397 domain-containing protein [Streptomyces sp. NBC_00287]
MALAPSTIRIRDSKNTQGPPAHPLPTTWSAFLTYAGSSTELAGTQ